MAEVVVENGYRMEDLEDRPINVKQDGTLGNIDFHGQLT
jgi:hypothetical protein